MEMEQQSTFNNTINNLNDTEFHDALEEYPFLDASTSFEESYQSVSTSDSDIINDEAPKQLLSYRTTRRRLLPPPASVTGDSFPRGVATNLKDNEKLNENLSLDSHGSSAITSVSDSQRVHDESTTVVSPNSGPDFLSMLAELVIEVISFQTKLLAKSVKFSIWLIHSLYMLICDPYAVIRLWRNDLQGGISGIWGICYNSCVKLINWFQTHESALKLCVQIGWGLLWLAYCGFVLVCLLVPAFVFGAVVVKWVVEEPVQIAEQLTFDYTKDTPMAFVPVVYCPDSSSLMHDIKIGSFAESRVVPFGHELKATVSLLLPESDYNRNLGIFQVRVDFLSSDGTLLASTRKPCMLQFKSEPIRLLSTFVKLAYLLTGYPSETQTLDMNFSGYTEKDVPLSCLRVVIEQRAEFAKGGGVPEIYSASLKLETQFPFLKRMLWYWKGLIYMWISVTLFITELLFTLLCYTPVIFPWVQRAGGSSINTAAHNKPPG
ncbi:putative Seipin family protein [Helianthus anomalus]